MGARGDGRERDPDALPRLALIADGFVSGRRLPDGAWVPEDEVQRRVVDLVRAGLRWVHLRDHAAPNEAFRDAAVDLAPRLAAAAKRGPRLWISVNSRISLVPELQSLVPGARVGGHLGKRGPGVYEAGLRLGPGVPLGVSTHSPEEARAAFRAGADYAFYSPVFATATHPEVAPVGIESLKQVCRAASGPVLALGGVTPERVGACLEAGAWGVAVLSALLDAPDPAAALNRFRAHLPNPQP